jgi:hypothetical protein
MFSSSDTIKKTNNNKKNHTNNTPPPQIKKKKKHKTLKVGPSTGPTCDFSKNCVKSFGLFI